MPRPCCAPSRGIALAEHAFSRWGSFERYCRSVEATAAWGGQLELRALAHVLRRRIVVYSAHLPTVEMGEEYRVEEHAPPLRVAYLQHAFGLGEHYNSVRQAARPDAAAGDSD